MKPEPIPSDREMLAGLVERVESGKGSVFTVRLPGDAMG